MSRPMSRRRTRREAGKAAAREATRSVPAPPVPAASVPAASVPDPSLPGRDRIRVTEVTLPAKRIADSLLMREDALRVTMRDGRAAWPFSEIWAERYSHIGAPDHAGEARGYAIVALGRGRVHFQRPKRFGASRSGDAHDLMADLADVREVILVDLRAFPRVDFYPLPSDHLIAAAEAGALGVNGWSGTRFDSWVSGRYDIAREKLSAAAMRRVNAVR